MTLKELKEREPAMQALWDNVDSIMALSQHEDSETRALVGIALARLVAGYAYATGMSESEAIAAINNSVRNLYAEANGVNAS